MKKLSIVLLLLALVLAVVPSALAQDTLNADKAVYDALVAAYDATGSVSSFSFDFSLAAGVTGMSEDEGGDVSATLTGSGIIIADEENPGLQLDVTGSASSGGEEQPLTFGIRVVDGMVYMTQDGESWQSMTLDEASSMLGGIASSSGLPVDPSMLSGDMSSMGDMGDMMAGFEDMQASDFVTLTNPEDNVYVLDLSFSDLFTSPAVAPLIAGAMGGSSGQEMTEAQMQQMAAMVGAMFSTATATLTQTVESGMVNSIVLDVSIPLDIVSPGAGVTLNFAINMSGFDDSYTIEAPEGATAMSS